ncbi:MAG TPA: hypothetical protein VEP90_04305 [Methylomirabilota bacterium]|nr:hypothetical protein [Methylomirabilota bacterium]
MSYQSGLIVLGHPQLISSGTTITFSSIPSVYSHLLLMMDIVSELAATIDTLRIRFNSDSGANYNNTGIYSLGGTVTENMTFGDTFGLLGNINGFNSPASRNSRVWVFIPDYANTNFMKNFISCSAASGASANAASNYTDNKGGIWLSTAAINTITLSNAGAAVFGSAGNPADVELCGLV